MSLILNEKAGIIDDTIISNGKGHFKVVVNGGNKDKDMVHIKKILEERF